MAELILHIGTEKTGSTALQHFLKENRDRLLLKKAAYLRSTGFYNAKDLVLNTINESKAIKFATNTGIKLGEGLSTWKEEFSLLFKNEIEELKKAGVKKFIISSELFHSRVTSLEEIEGLKRFLSNYFDKVVIVIYLRRQDLLATSLYSTYLRKGGTRDNVLPDLNEINHYYYDYNTILERWSSVFDKENIIVKIFEKDKLLNSDILHDFLALINIELNPKDFIITQRQNEALSRTTQEILRVFNERVPFSPKNPLGLKKFRAKLTNYIQNNAGGSGKKPTKEQAINFYKYFHEGNKKLFEEWLNGETFSNAFDYPESNESTPISLEETFIIFEAVNEFFNKFSVIETESLNSIMTSNENKVEKFRSLAFQFENIDLATALFFLKEAYDLSPGNTYFERKISEWERKIK